MSLKIASWNVARKLSDPKRHQKIQAGLEVLDADVVVLSEAFDKTGRPVNLKFARESGYHMAVTEYGDADEHPSQKQWLCLLSRKAIGSSVIRLASRNALRATVTADESGRKVEVIGSHFDDRSERLRRAMGRSLLEQIDLSEPTIVAGDLNTMPGDRFNARLLGSGPARLAARMAPHPRIKSLGGRLNEMASGETLELLTTAGLADADPRHRSTMTVGGLAVAQLDHILYTPDSLSVDAFTRHDLEGSDIGRFRLP